MPATKSFWQAIEEHLVGGDTRCVVVIHANGNVLSAACTWHTIHLKTSADEEVLFALRQQFTRS